MMRVADIVTLAATKLRMHRIRTGLTIGVAGILFGVLLAVAMIAQGVFRSVDNFNKEGLGSRYILSIYEMDNSGGVYEYAHDPEFIALIEEKYASLVAKKEAAAKKHDISYDPKIEDPSPVIRDEQTGEKVIDDRGIVGNSPLLTEAAEEFHAAKTKPFDISAYLEPYESARVLGGDGALTPASGLLVYMKNDKEKDLTDAERQTAKLGFTGGQDEKTLAVLPQTLADPFILNQAYDPSSGELPVIFPYSDAQKLLKLTPLPKTASTQQKRDRIQQVQSRVGEITVSFCYRNHASDALLQQAKAMKERTEQGEQPGQLIYEVPADGSCGAIKVTKDGRSEAQKQQDEARIAYEKEVGEYIGDPEQHLLTFRGVGISGDASSGGDGWTAAGLVQGLLSSSLGFGQWNIPSGLLEQTPASARPAAIFEAEASSAWFNPQLVEFDDKADARAVLEKTGFYSSDTRSVGAVPYGSSSLIVDEMRKWVNTALTWAMIAMGMIAVVILGGLVARTIADGRKETAVFRAIGATRGNMISVYTMYTILFALRIVLFALILGIALSITTHLLLYQDATTGAQIAFGVADMSKLFYFIDVRTWYIPIVVGVIVGAALLAMAIPLLRNVRRNPIRDMRDDT